MEDTNIKPLIDRLPKPAAARALACVALLCLLCVGCQTTARETYPISTDDIDPNVALPCSLKEVWYRTEEKQQFGVPFDQMGSLLVSGEALVFTYEGGSVNIPARNITSVVWRSMLGDPNTEWAVVYWNNGDAQNVTGFTAADRYRFHTSNRQLYSSIVRAWKMQR